MTPRQYRDQIRKLRQKMQSVPNAAPKVIIENGVVKTPLNEAAPSNPVSDIHVMGTPVPPQPTPQQPKRGCGRCRRQLP